MVTINKIMQYDILEYQSPYYANRIRGNDINDLYVAGAYGHLAHFGGTGWWYYPEVINGTYKGLDVKGNLVVAVGQKGHNALITVLVRP